MNQHIRDESCKNELNIMCLDDCDHHFDGVDLSSELDYVFESCSSTFT